MQESNREAIAEMAITVKVVAENERYDPMSTNEAMQITADNASAFPLKNQRLTRACPIPSHNPTRSPAADT